MPSILDPWEMLNQWQRLDQMQSLVNSIQNRCSMCSNTHLDGECQSHSMMCSDNLGYLDPQMMFQNDPNTFQPHPFHSQPFEIYPHSPYTVYEPQPYELPNLRDTPLAYLSSNAAFSPPSDPIEDMIKELEDILRSFTYNMSKILTELPTQAQEGSEESRNQAGANSRIQKVERRTHTTSITPDTDLHPHEFGCNIPSTPTPTQSSTTSTSPVPDLSTSKIDGGFVLEELSEPLQLKTSGRSDEDDEVDEEIEMESPNLEIYTEDSASHGLEGYIPIKSSKLIQTDMVEHVPQPVVVDCIPKIPLTDSLPDLIDFTSALEETNTQVFDDNVATRLETLMDIFPPPRPEYNILIKPKTIGS